MPGIGYVRFVTHRMDEASLTWQGVFHAVTELKRSEKLDPYVWDWLEHDLGWLNKHLPVPACFRERGADEGVCWFHPRAGADRPRPQPCGDPPGIRRRSPDDEVLRAGSAHLRRPLADRGQVGSAPGVASPEAAWARVSESEAAQA